MIDGLISVKDNFVIKENKDFAINENSNVNVIGTSCNIYDFSNDKNVSVYVDENSTVNYYVINSKNTNRIFNVCGTLNIVSISFVKNEEKLKVNLNSNNAVLNVKNLVVANGITSTFTQNATHNEKNTFSNVENVGISFNGGNITFDTTGKIEKGMSKTKCSQLSRGIVMDNQSTVTAKPILLIDEFDCFANHGAAIGKMSDEDLFYLMSRGLTKDEAFLLILGGMVKPFIDSIPNELLRNEVEESINKLILR